MSNLRKVITVMSSASSLALILAGTAMAAPPTTFDNWSVGSTSAGIVTANTGICATGSGFTCATVADGAGFLQQEVTSNTPGGPRYVRTLIAEGFVAAAGNFANLAFASEDFVQLGGAQGLASKMTIREGTASPTGTAPASITSGFSLSAQILSGWGAFDTVNNKSEAILSLSLSDWGADPDGAGALTAAAAGGDEFLTSFSVTASTLLSGTNVTAALGVDQTIYVGGPNTVANPTAAQDRQRFVTLVENAAAASPVGGFKFAANTTDPATLAWVAGATPDKIQVVWAGQNIGGAGAFSTESVTRLTGTTPATVSGSNLTSQNTFEWGTGSVLLSEFGAAPTF